MGISDLYKILIPREVEREVDNSIELQLEAQNSQELNDMYTALMAGAGEFGTGEYTGPTKKELGLTPPVESSDKVAETLLKEQIKNAIPVNLITQEELDKQTSMINRGETEPVVTEQSSPVKSSDKVAATPDVKKDVEEKKQKDKEKSKAETIGTTYTSSSLYDSLKSKDEKIFNAAAKYLYDKGIIRTEWGDQKPLFDFVRYYSGGNSSAFGPGQIVYSTAQKMLDKGFIKDKETKQFAKKMIAAQKIFKNMIDNRNKHKEYRPEKAVNTPKARDEKWLETLGITEKEFLDYVNQGYDHCNMSYLVNNIM